MSTDIRELAQGSQRYSNLLVALVAAAFTAWAGIVGWLGYGIRTDLAEIAKTATSINAKVDNYRLTTDVRLARIETQLRTLENEVRDLDKRVNK